MVNLISDTLCEVHVIGVLENSHMELWQRRIEVAFEWTQEHLEGSVRSEELGYPMSVSYHS